MSQHSFCLVDEKWIPVVGHGQVSLMDIFADDTLVDIAGNPIQKIAVMKLLVAIAQASVRVENEKAWSSLGTDGLSAAVQGYLSEHRQLFDLYGDRPFLQMPQLRARDDAAVKEIFFTYQPDLASDNDSIVFESQGAQTLDDADMALFLIQLMNYAPGGKRVSNIGALSDSFSGKTKSAKAGPSLGGFEGYLQVCMMGRSIRESVYLNYLCEDEVIRMMPDARIDARPPWEMMPECEDDENAKMLQHSVYSWLVGLSRFVLLCGQGMKYAEGLVYPSYIKDGYFEPFIACDRTSQKAIYVRPSRQPWRSLEALLQGVYVGSGGYDCAILSSHWNRTKASFESFSIWAGGLKVRSNSGDQSVKQSDNYVESQIELFSDSLDTDFYYRLKANLDDVEALANSLCYAVSKYGEDMGMTGEVKNSAGASFWTVADGLSDEIISCAEERDEEWRSRLMAKLAFEAYAIYDRVCRHETAREMICWMNHRRIGAKWRKKNAE